MWPLYAINCITFGRTLVLKCSFCMLKVKEQFVLVFSDWEQSPPVEKVLSSLQMDLLVPYSQLLLSSQAELPGSCLAFGLQASLTQWYIFSEAEELRQTRTELGELIQVRQEHRSVLE